MHGHVTRGADSGCARARVERSAGHRQHRQAAPADVEQRLRTGCASPRGAERLVSEALTQRPVAASWRRNRAGASAGELDSLLVVGAMATRGSGGVCAAETELDLMFCVSLIDMGSVNSL